MLNMQNVKDIEITEGDVRTIHDKDNQLIWGRLAYDTKYAGDTYQQTYSGKNLFDSPTSVTQTYRASYSQIDANSFAITSTETTNGTAYIRIDETLQPNQTYTISWSKTVTAGTPTSIAGNLAVQVGTSGTIPSPIPSPVTVTTDSSGLLRLYFYLGYAGSGTTTLGDSIKIYNVQLEQGSTSTSYEPYVGGIPAPNPDYPQTVQTVTGEQTVTVTGKNLFDGVFELGDINIGTGQNVPNNTRIRTKNYILINPSTTYTISGVTKSRYAIFYDENKSFISNHLVDSQAASGTFTTPANARYIRWYQISNSDITTLEMLELGSTATAYEPYQGQSYTISLGSLEFRKIGNYQDYIFKSGDDWYVHRETNKSVYPSSTGWNLGGAYDGYQGFYAGQYTMVVGRDTPIYTNYFKQVPYESASQSPPTEECFMINANSSNSTMIFYSRIITSLSELNDYFSTTPMSFYFPLKTPIDTQITDATLVGQLNDVHEWLTRYGYNATVTGNLPIIINQTNL